MAIDETGLAKGQVRNLNALRKSVGDDLAEEVFAKWLERAAASQAKDKPDPVAMKIVEALAGFVHDPKFKLGNYGYTLRRAKGKGVSGVIAYKNEKADRASAPSSKLSLRSPAKKRGQLCLGPLLREQLWRWTVLQMSNAAIGTSRTTPEAPIMLSGTTKTCPAYQTGTTRGRVVSRRGKMNSYHGGR